MSADLTAKNVSYRNTTRQIYMTEGIRGFYAGIGPTLLRAFPVNAAALFVYEGILRVMNAEKVHLTHLIFTTILIIECHV